MSKPTSIRLDVSLLVRLRRRAQATTGNMSALAQRLINEAFAWAATHLPGR